MKPRHPITHKLPGGVLTRPTALICSLGLIACGPPAPTNTPPPTGSTNTETESAAPCDQAEPDCAPSSAPTSTVRPGSLEEFWVALDDAVVLAPKIDESWLSEDKRRALALLSQQREDPSIELDVPEDTPLTPSDVTLPADLLAWKGKTLAVWSKDDIRADPAKAENRTAARTPGPPCLATITDVHITNVADPSFETVRSVWSDSLNGVVVVGRLSAPCPGALFATTSPALALQAPKTPSAELARLAASAFLADPERQGCPEQALSTSLFESAQGQLLLVVSGYDPDKDSGFTVFFEKASQGNELRFLTSTNQDLTPQVAVDIDGDGRLEIVLGPDGLENARHLFFSATGSIVQALSSPMFQCSG